MALIPDLDQHLSLIPWPKAYLSTEFHENLLMSDLRYTLRWICRQLEKKKGIISLGEVTFYNTMRKWLHVSTQATNLKQRYTQLMYIYMIS